MPDNVRTRHISSAVVSALPHKADSVALQLASMEGVEVRARHQGKIVVVIEGDNTGAMGDSLTRMALLDGVVAANMVFEHIEEAEVTGQ
ncbi:chaperone NapD (plasmid) [Aminobacter sp. SR38]|jgi:nitrate reductase NapD|uniref:chaperone NapD n=1 Tax=Aminobacter sp. SR38 TaxID=2774562 RepID=UPI00177F5296|nr:chaperone NapD [Aminobacter sp. SR38]QOF75606.1 chaperone NapD [Aminobacter sp. SR38]